LGNPSYLRGVTPEIDLRDAAARIALALTKSVMRSVWARAAVAPRSSSTSRRRSLDVIFRDFCVGK
jgi:hypothetical protein